MDMALQEGMLLGGRLLVDMLLGDTGPLADTALQGRKELQEDMELLDAQAVDNQQAGGSQVVDSHPVDSHLADSHLDNPFADRHHSLQVGERNSCVRGCDEGRGASQDQGC